MSDAQQQLAAEAAQIGNAAEAARQAQAPPLVIGYSNLTQTLTITVTRTLAVLLPLPLTLA